MNDMWYKKKISEELSERFLVALHTGKGYKATSEEFRYKVHALNCQEQQLLL